MTAVAADAWELIFISKPSSFKFKFSEKATKIGAIFLSRFEHY